MNIKENFKITGELAITVRDQAGRLKETIVVPNKVVTVGKEYTASRMIQNTPSVMTHMAIGTDNTLAAVENTALLAQTGRVTLTSSSVSGTTITYTATFGPNVGTGAITEAGIFNASTGGIMLCRTTFSVVNKEANDSISISWVVTVS